MRAVRQCRVTRVASFSGTAVPLTHVRGGRDALVVRRRGRKKRLCACVASPAQQAGPSTSPLGCTLTTPRRLTTSASFLLACLGSHKDTVADSPHGARDVTVPVYMDEKHACTVDGESVPCPDVGKRIRLAHPSGNPKVLFCGDRTLTYEVIGSLLRSIYQENLPAGFGCASVSAPPTSRVQPNNRWRGS